MQTATTVSLGPIFPGDHNLLLIVGASYAFGYLVAAVVSRGVSPRSEMVRRRVGAAAVVVLGIVWFIDAVLRHKGYPVLPSGRLTLLDAAAAFSLGPVVATVASVRTSLADPAAVQGAVDIRGTYIGVVAGLLAIGMWLGSGP